MNVSIVTPTWNRAEALPQMLASVETQTPRPLEHIIVDNRSTDGSATIVNEYARRVSYRVLHLTEGDCGIYDAMNQGARAAEGDVLYFLNDDDRLANPKALGTLTSALSRYDADFAFGDVLVVDPQRGTSSVRHHRQMNRFTLAEKSICQQATIYSRRIIDQVGPFDASLRAAGDYDWMMRAFLQHASKAVYLRTVVAHFALGGISNSEAHSTAFEAEMRSVRLRYFSEEDLERAKRFRRFWRKCPFGLQLMPNAGRSTAFRIATLHPVGDRLIPSPLAWIGF